MQKGGLVKKDKDTTNFDAFMNMMNNQRAEISKISFSSLYGFIFKLHIPEIEECEQQFYGLNEGKNDFDVPIDTIVIKISILSEKSKSYNLVIEDENVEKKSDNSNDFKNEAILQSNIYSNSLIYGDPLCPCLLDLFILDTSTSTSTFLNVCLSKCKDEDSKTVTKKLIELTKENKLGIIVMESAIEYSDFGTYDELFEEQKKVEQEERTMIEEKLRAIQEKQQKLTTILLTKLIRLYNECKVVHCDLHMGNSLVKQNDDDSFSIYLIDFGRYVRSGNNNVVKTFDNDEVSKILTRCVFEEKRYRKEKNHGVYSKIKKYYLDTGYSIEDLVDSLNTFYSLRTNKYKTLSYGDFTQNKVKNTQFQCGTQPVSASDVTTTINGDLHPDESIRGNATFDQQQQELREQQMYEKELRVYEEQMRVYEEQMREYQKQQQQPPPRQQQQQSYQQPPQQQQNGPSSFPRGPRVIFRSGGTYKRKYNKSKRKRKMTRRKSIKPRRKGHRKTYFISRPI
jgi:hypothetical protein